jgi:hypothetical protein
MGNRFQLYPLALNETDLLTLNLIYIAKIKCSRNYLFPARSAVEKRNTL